MKMISRMLVDGSGAVNLMLYSVFKEIGREDDKLMKTNLALNGMGGGVTPWKLGVSSPWSSP
jgi:hypothetical protein